MFRPEEQKSVTTIHRFGPVGMAIDLVQPAFRMKINSIEPDSPAAATGKLKKGQLILSINGETLKDIDPRIQLGNLITKAEATDGLIRLVVQDDEKSPQQTVDLKIEVLGSYSPTWPLNCPKSDKIVRNFADILEEGLARTRALPTWACSSSSPPAIKAIWTTSPNGPRAAKTRTSRNMPGPSATADLALCEYYLRTGDPKPSAGDPGSGRFGGQGPDLRRLGRRAGHGQRDLRWRRRSPQCRRHPGGRLPDAGQGMRRRCARSHPALRTGSFLPLGRTRRRALRQQPAGTGSCRQWQKRRCSRFPWRQPRR